MHKIFALITVAIGLALMIFMITVEDEPGALPLLMIIIGAVWYYFARRKKNNLNKVNS
ncbi:MAG: hypothetical protein WCZ90_06305 [Melioribacteraceae bacterium]